MTEKIDGDAWIRVEGVGYAYGGHQVLRDISLNFLPGRHYVVSGPNGAGKSTLLDLLARLNKTAAGEIRVMGRRAEQYAAAEYARILALAPQEFRFDFSFTVRETVAMGRRPHLDRWGRLDARDEGVVEQAMADMELAPFADKAVTALSGGERRRCVIARALAQETPVLLLDEPTAGLDIDRGLSVMARARRLAESGSLVITVTHDLNLAARYADEFVFLKNGRLVAHGAVEETFTDSVLSGLYDAEARVGWDAFAEALSVSFR